MITEQYPISTIAFPLQAARPHIQINFQFLTPLKPGPLGSHLRRVRESNGGQANGTGLRLISEMPPGVEIY